MNRISKSLTWLPVIAVLLISTQSAYAHSDSHQAAGFITGFGHPWSGWDHIIAMIAVGLWGAQLGAPAVWLLPVTFPMVMAVGAFFGLIGVPLPGIEIGIGISALLLGTMLAFEAKPALWIAAVMVGVFGLFHGHAHGTELPDGQNGTLYSMGFVIATGCIHGVGIAFGLVHRWSAGKAALRLAGTAIAVVGAVFTWRALA
jgi:urease accessory protein